MRARVKRRSPWILVGLCLGLTFLPATWRGKLRAGLRGMHAALRLPFQGRSAARESEPTARERLQAGELERLRRALAAARVTRAALDSEELGELELIPAEVLPLAGAAGLVQRVLLARGSRHGVRRGLPVLCDGVLVGRVAAVDPATCELRLVTDPGFRLRVAIPREDGELEGLVRGDGSELLRVELALLDVEAAAPTARAGESVLSSRASLLCGVPALLGAVEATPAGPRVRPARDLHALRRVVILKTPEGRS